MAHVGEEDRLRLVRILRRRQRFRKRVVLCHGFPHLFIDHGKSEADRMDFVVIPVPGVPHACHPEHFIIFDAVSARKIPVNDDRFRIQRFPDIDGIDELQEILLIFRIHIPFAVIDKSLMIREMHALRRLVRIPRISTVANSIVRIQIDMVDAAVIGGHCSDHTVQLFLLFLFLDQLLLQCQLLFQFLLLGVRFRFRRLNARHLRDIHAHAEQALSPVRIRKFGLCRLQIPENGAGRVRNILKENIRGVHGDRLLIVFHEMIRRLRIEDLMVRQTDDLLRMLLAGVFRKSLVAGKIPSGLDILGKAHGGHIGQQGCNGAHQVRQLCGRLHLLHQAAVLLLRLPQVFQRLLRLHPSAVAVLYILKAHRDAGPAAGHVHFSEIHPVMSGTGFKRADKIDRELIAGLKLLQDKRKADLLLHPLLVFLRHHRIHILGFGIRIFRVAQRVANGFTVRLIHVCMIKRTAFRDDIVDQPDGIVGVGQRRDDGIPHSRILLPQLPFLRNIGNKHRIDAAVSSGSGKMPMVFHETDGAVTPDDAVFHMIRLPVIVFDLLLNDLRYFRIIIGADHPPKGKAGQLRKFFPVSAAEYIKHCLICVDQFFRFFRSVQEKPAGHMTPDLFDHRKRLLIQFKCFCFHHPAASR